MLVLNLNNIISYAVEYLVKLSCRLEPRAVWSRSSLVAHRIGSADSSSSTLDVSVAMCRPITQRLQATANRSAAVRMGGRLLEALDVS